MAARLHAPSQLQRYAEDSSGRDPSPHIQLHTIFVYIIKPPVVTSELGGQDAEHPELCI